ncbi:ankyrin repeat domain-containing protein [Polyangium jinanense]|uniref:Ankyrin repeat domain-containing protein n=1 Tax=Polyangium jinanense TaxID=2829994 RepID=A0A9X3X2H2_9BACT|nr:ankyrin repeat domain-containing protein [Polyangium jinanense]MDC3954700.1 ankyrin repeat domain-containing protein [Polyangium jinanense]MDC3981003.1 ankyrin repeat domain-containing protein [Polyangium jinanense]
MTITPAGSAQALAAALRHDDPSALGALLDDLPADSPPLVPMAVLAKAHRSLDLLLSRGFSANETRVDRLAGLHLVNDAKMVRTLVAAGGDVNLASPSGTPLHLAAANASPPVIKALLDAGADPNATHERHPTIVTPLEVACELGRTMAVKALLARPPAHATCFFLTAGFVTRKGKKALAVLDLLLAAFGADIEPPAGYDFLLHIASKAGCLDGVERLLAHGATVDRPDREGRTAALLAIHTAFAGLFPRPEHVEVFRRLAAAGANLDQRFGNVTPRQLARQHGITLP